VIPHAVLQFLRPRGHADREHDGEGDRDPAASAFNQKGKRNEAGSSQKRPLRANQRDTITTPSKRAGRDDEEPADDLGHTASMWSLGRACCTSSVVRPKKVFARSA